MIEQVRKLQDIYQPPQRSEEWFKLRKGKVTASSAASLLIRESKIISPYVKEFGLSEDLIDNAPANPYSSEKEYILNKCGHRAFTGSAATYWGTMLEQVATDIYCRRERKSIIEFGLLPHPTIPFIAASPDGITPKGIMLEIKCPFRRKITGIPPFYYWVQMQLQLEVADLKKCDFLECGFAELNKDEYARGFGGPEEQGLFLEIRPEGLKDRAESNYIYPHTYEKDLDVWLSKKLEKTQIKYPKCKVFPVYWRLTKYSNVRVIRNEGWFKDAVVELEKGWKKVLHYREIGCEELLGPPKKKKNVLTFNDIEAGPIVKDFHIMSDSEEE